MYNVYQTYPCPYFVNNADIMYNAFRGYPYPYYVDTPMYNPDFSNQFANQYVPFTDELEYDPRFNFWQPEADYGLIELKDYGPDPFVVNIEEATKQNNNFRTALWTGDHLQLTLMSIGVGEDIGLEVHPHLDQFIRIEEGEGVVMMGDRRDNLSFQERVYDDFAFIIPAGKWHNLINTGDKPIKLYSIYAPPQHPKGTVHETKAIAEAAEKH
ncbi:cupin domain-containing protein [Clostridium sp. MSJ-4]|uniref:Cupin domain-containing protein n=1 Tax=Clostridium simiarum TaxID=2841506 RepID=A0ABS6F298_9CLOT|nr:cupin domain-containing protein [Clostridium simiarum]MBU5591667.1 cupin domain-containing protein [Clostridium simiarum]